MMCAVLFFFFLQFKQISQAYEVLSDSKKREIYNRGGEKGIKEGGTSEGSRPSFASPMDIFDLLFGGGLRPHREQKGTVKYSKKCLKIYFLLTFITRILGSKKI